MDDLISRAALLNDLSYCAPELWQDEEYIKAKIIKQPAVDAAPVVHGRWRSIKAVGGPNYPYWDAKCSECGYTTKSTAGWLYCPHCGAKMDEEG